MNRDQINQLAQLALATRDPDLMAKAVQELMATKQAEALPLFQPQPAIHEAGVSAASLAAALDNLPPLVAKQEDVQRVELEAVVPKADSNIWAKGPEYIAALACEEWYELYGRRWMTNTAAFGANAPYAATKLGMRVRYLARSKPGMSQRTLGKLFWERIEQIKPKGWLVQERVRMCSGYTVTEHSIVPTGGQA